MQSFTLQFRLLKKEGLISFIAQFPIIDDLLCTSDKQYPIFYQRMMELSVNLIFGLFRKINYHITAYNQMAIFRILIAQQIVLSKLHSLLNLIRDFKGTANSGEVFFLQILRYTRNALMII